MCEFFKTRTISCRVFKQHEVPQKKSLVGKADIINVCDILRHFSNTSPPVGEICTFLKQAQIYFSDVSVLLSVISGPLPDWVRLEVIRRVQCTRLCAVRHERVFPPTATASCDSESETPT